MRAGAGHSDRYITLPPRRLISDLALLEDDAFKTHVESYAKDQSLYFKDFTSAWVKLQENGCTDLRDAL